MELSCRERNVLRRLINRAEFKPQDIAQLGIARLESAEGLGVKGLTNVLDWLATNGYPLTPTSTRASEDALRKDRINRRLDQAQHLLKQWGWQVNRPDCEPANRE